MQQTLACDPLAARVPFSGLRLNERKLKAADQ
jgi:hypothetical protein